MGTRLKNLATLANTSIERNAQYIESRMEIISIVGTIFFPLYYVIWHYIFPQQYENIALRLVGCALFLPFMFAKHWPQWLIRYKSIYWHLAILYSLPFFFTFMLLMNSASTVWLMSTLVAVFLMMILLLSWYNLIIQFALGTTLAWLAYYLTDSHAQVPAEYWKYLPIYFFAIVAGGLLNFSSKRIHRERLRAMLTTSSNVAHELRTPLLGIKSGAAGLRQFLPSLLDTYRVAKEHGLAVPPIRLAHLNSMHGVLERIESEANHSNIIIDMLLMNTSVNGFKPEIFSTCSIVQCVEVSLQRYPFSSEKERQLVTWAPETNFNFTGIELLMVHVLFNLLKNALFHIAKAGKGKIVIQLKHTPQGNILIFRDTGTGVPPDVLPHIFTRFYSWSADNTSGTGIGLAFCQSVMNSMEGDIRCESQLGEYTEFILTFPPEKSP